jgi:hypothetical protein
MPQHNCPSCGKSLSIPEDLVGRQVRCSACATVFVAGVKAEPPSASAGETAAQPPEKPERRPAVEDADDRPRRYEDDDDSDDQVRRPRRDALPHRGNTILTLGISALACIGLCPFLTPVLGIIAWVMGSHDLREIRAGNLDPNGESSTQAGKICGIVAVGLSVLGCVAYICFMVLSLVMQGVIK